MDGIRIVNVKKSFGETHALTNASLAAAMGEVHAIVGENGSGKSTLAKIISGVLTPDAGSVTVLGDAPRDPGHSRQLGVATIFQEMMLAEELSVAENVFAGADGFLLKKMSSGAKNLATKALIERLSGQQMDPTTKVADLPLHLKQWIVLARAIRTEPRVLILDESSAALDLAATERLHQEIRRLRDRGACVLIVTHRIAELVKIADKATVLRDGETVGTLSKSEITEKNLLRLLSAGKVQSVQQAGSLQAARAQAQTLLRCDGFQLASGTAAFDFSLREGEIVGVTGLDGAGQTEFVRALVGVDQPFAGIVEARNAEGEPVLISSVKDAYEARISYVSGDRKKEGIFPALSTFENFGIALYARHRQKNGLIDAKSLRKSFLDEVARLGIKVGAAGNRITSLSGGNQQKILIARAFSSGPKVIVLNDPARGVDIGTKQELYR
ncbi:sugar ABC transporter ATP-binding protein, partial [Mesorhizobium sp. M7A.F.Ca.US.006.01.1.1]|uniref:ATP-binding cassette domain-containing protein n=1 Tax=Mesorhizobium sp. M7A.F.Ca.US.006.01.1.1 TaxID=2496707 RepID=UPI000FD577AC